MKYRLPEHMGQELWNLLRNEWSFRVPCIARLRIGVGRKYDLIEAASLYDKIGKHDYAQQLRDMIKEEQ